MKLHMGDRDKEAAGKQCRPHSTEPREPLVGHDARITITLCAKPPPEVTECPKTDVLVRHPDPLGREFAKEEPQAIGEKARVREGDEDPPPRLFHGDSKDFF